MLGRRRKRAFCGEQAHKLQMPDSQLIDSESWHTAKILVSSEITDECIKITVIYLMF